MTALRFCTTDAPVLLGAIVSPAGERGRKWVVTGWDRVTLTVYVGRDHVLRFVSARDVGLYWTLPE